MLSVGASAVMDTCGATLKSDFAFSEAHIDSGNLFKWHLKLHVKQGLKCSEKSLTLDPRVKACVIVRRPPQGLLSNQEQFRNLRYSDLLRLVSVPLFYLSLRVSGFLLSKSCVKNLK